MLFIFHFNTLFYKKHKNNNNINNKSRCIATTLNQITYFRHTYEIQIKGLHGSDVKVIQKNANNKPLNVKMGFSDSGIA